MRVLRLWPLAVLLVATAIVWASGIAGELNWANLARHQAALTTWVAAHPLAAPSLFLLAYATAVAISLPQAAIFTAAGGFLFGALYGGALAVIGASLGATALFLAIRYHLAPAIADRGARLLGRLRPALERDGFLYLLAIRLVPLFPFWLVNLAAALSGMRLLPYAAATVIGIMPVTFIFASIGAGLGDVLAAGARPDLSVILAPRILMPLVGLAALALLPIAWRHWKGGDG